MSKQEIIRSLGDVAGTRLVEIDESVLQGVTGAEEGCGLVCTSTYDCDSSYFHRLACKIYHNIVD